MDEKEFRTQLRKKIGSPDEVDKSILEIVPYEYPGRDINIEIVYPEFTSLCPRTGLPDFGKITIRYIPDTHIIELKSLKYYLMQYRWVGIFYEHLINRILEDLVSLVKPKSMEVIGEFNPRGGMTTKVVRRWESGKTE